MSNPAADPHLVIDHRYRVLRVLGEGGMGVVYEAQHVGTKRPFAVKVIHASIARRQAALERFLREGEATGTIRSPHVIDISDVGIDRATGSAFMAMEMLSGEDLGKLIEERGRVSPQLALRIAAQALTGLAAAHAAGVVHRDIKPSNLFLARKPANPLASAAVWVEGQRVLKVLDFGIAKLRAGEEGEEGKRNLTKTGGLVGSPSYMSPEQSGGLPDIDQRTDVWSLGAVLYEALTGTTPYHGAANLNQLITQLALGPPQLITQRDPNVPPELAAIVTRAMMHDPAERYPTAEAMLADVRRWIVGPEVITEEMLPVSIAAMVAAGPAPMVVGAGAAGQVGQGGAAVPVKGETQPLPSGPLSGVPGLAPRYVATQAAMGRTVEPGQTRKLALIAAGIIGATIVLALIVVSLVPRRGAQVQGAAGVPDAAGEAGAELATGTAGHADGPRDELRGRIPWLRRCARRRSERRRQSRRGSIRSGCRCSRRAWAGKVSAGRDAGAGWQHETQFRRKDTLSR